MTNLTRFNTEDNDGSSPIHDNAAEEAARRQEETLARLRKRLEVYGLAIITGAGVTLNATADDSGKPLTRITWKGLVHNGLDYLVDGYVEKSNERILRAYKTLEEEGADGTLDAAHILRGEMKKAGQFMTWLESVFANLSQEVRHSALLDVLEALHEKGVALLTTNYDDVLEKYCGLDGVVDRTKTRFHGSSGEIFMEFSTYMGAGQMQTRLS